MSSSSNHSNSNYKSLFESLEDRVLFDGVPDATFILPQADAAEPVPAQVQNVHQADVDGPKELILIDAGVQNSETLLEEVLQNRPDSAFEVRMIDGDANGVAQISELLAASEGKYDAIHIISHGQEGEVSLGNTSLSTDNLGRYANELASWSDSLSADADILFYGCDLAGNAEGTQFIESISAMTGADVAASDDLTGAADKGGDWDLELNVGTVETAALSATAFEGVLADQDGDGVDDADDADKDGDGILDSDEGAGLLTEVVTFGGGGGNTVSGTTASGATVDAIFGLNPRRIGTESTTTKIDNDNFTFITPGTTSIADTNVFFNGGNIGSFPTTFDLNIGNTSATEVYLHVNSIDQFRLNFTPTADLGFELLSSNPTATDTGTGGSLSFGDGDQSNQDGSAEDEELDGDGAGSADGTIRFFSLTGAPITNISFDLTEQPNRGAGADGWQIGVEVVSTTVRDTDGDGIADHCDLDSDNDGISDLIESGDAVAIAADTDGDGMISAAEATAAGLTDADGDGVLDALGNTPVDSDGDGIDDYLDLDSDNDGIPDAVEAQPTVGYTTPDGTTLNTPVDTDGDGTPDYLDNDSDGDGASDTDESGLTLSGDDLDGDGIDDAVNASYADPDGDVSDPINDLENATDNDPSDVDYRSVNDQDGDGVADFEDLDKDGDGILDTDEGVSLPEFVNGDFSAGPAGYTTTGPIDYTTITGGPNTGDTVARLDNNRATASFSQVLGGAETTISELEFQFGWNNGTLFGTGFGQNIEIKVNGVTYLTIETPDGGGTNQDNATDLGGDARLTASNGATFLVEDPSVQGPQFIDTSQFNAWTLRTITLTLPSDISSPVFSLESGPRPGNGVEVSDDFAVTAFAVTQGAVVTDTDGDGVPDHCDLDSDNDGISDLVESGNAVAIAADTDGDGMISAAEATAAGLTDSDGDGVLDALGATPVDTDGDGIADYLDLDSDNDGIPDTVEAQTTAGYIPPTNMDTDGDGVDDAYDPDSGGQFSIPVDTDGDGTPDQLDTDSDNDGFSDSTESGLVLSGNDDDGDGIDDAVNASYTNTDGDVGDPSNDLDNEAGDTFEVGYRELGATIGAAKEITSGPTLLANNTYSITYSVVIENTNNADLGNLSVLEDLATEFGPAFVSASNLTLAVGPTDPGSSITIDSAWDGAGATDFIDNSGATTTLASGDSFTVTFDVIVNPTTSALDNQVTAAGTALDFDGNPVLDAAGNPLVVTDDSDSGADPDDPNAGADGDTGGSDDATPLYIPAIGLAKQAGDAVANGDNFDVEFTLVWENTGNVALDGVTVFDDIATQFGAQFVGIVPGSLAVANFAGTGTAPTANAAFEGDTTQSLISSAGALEAGDSFEIVFTVTIDPDVSGASTSGLENQASSTGTGINPDTGVADPTLAASDVSDNGTDPTTENGADENADGTFGNDPTPIIIPDISVAKEVVSTTPNGDNFDVVYQLVVENTGNVDLADVSLIDDLATQFGGAFVSAGSPSLVTAPTDTDSSITIDAAWDGDANAEIIDQSVTTNLLKVGDSFVVQITVTVDPDATGTSGPLNNQATAGGDAVDDMGNPLTNAAGDPIVTTDLSDSGSDPNGSNPGRRRRYRRQQRSNATGDSRFASR